MRLGRCFEAPYGWKSATQFEPMTVALFRRITSQTDGHSLLADRIKQRRITWEEVRTERKIVAFPSRTH
jgi:hypothetical protein